MNLEYGADGAILTEMASNRCAEVDESAHMEMRIVNPYTLSVSIIKKGSFGPVSETQTLLEAGKLRSLNINRGAMTCLNECKVIKGHPVTFRFLCDFRLWFFYHMINLCVISSLRRLM